MPRILVVDDEPHLRELVATVLTLEGHDVDMAADGREALMYLSATVPDLVLLDLAMPGMDGWRFLQELYERGLRACTRLVIMSGHEDSFFVRAGSGVRCVLQKPFDADALLGVVDEALDQPPQELLRRKERTGELVRLLEEVDQILT